MTSPPHTTDPAMQARTTLTTPAGDIKKGTGSLVAVVFGVLLMVFGMTWGFIAVLVTKSHSNFDDVLVGSCLLVAFICVLPANFSSAVNVLKPVLPWGRRKDDV